MNKLTERKVDTKKEYFELTYGSVKVDKPTFVRVALLGKTNDNEFVYEFIGEQSDEVKKDVLKDLEFYLIKHGSNSFMKDVWEYAKYHTTTNANVYSDVHWNFYPAK